MHGCFRCARVGWSAATSIGMLPWRRNGERSLLWTLISSLCGGDFLSCRNVDYDGVVSSGNGSGIFSSAHSPFVHNCRFCAHSDGTHSHSSSWCQEKARRRTMAPVPRSNHLHSSHRHNRAHRCRHLPRSRVQAPRECRHQHIEFQGRNRSNRSLGRWCRNSGIRKESRSRLGRMRKRQLCAWWLDELRANSFECAVFLPQKRLFRLNPVFCHEFGDSQLPGFR